MASDKPVRILTIAGSDSGGGAGIQADIKTISALGGYAMSAVTAVTVQNTLGITDVLDVPAELIAGQIRAVVTDIGVDAIKIGMLRSAEAIEAVASVLDSVAEDVPLVIDPILAASDGTPFLEAGVMEVFRAGLLPLADVATPNLAEAQSLSGIEVTSLDQMKAAADKIMMLGCAAVLVTGGHLEGPEVFDVLCSEETLETMVAPRLDASHTHGTGCTLSSAIATFMAQGFDLREACYMAREFVREAIIHAPGFGQGNGPLNHQYAIQIENPN